MTLMSLALMEIAPKPKLRILREKTRMNSPAKILIYDARPFNETHYWTMP